jgi:hypothetical protein
LNKRRFSDDICQTSSEQATTFAVPFQDHPNDLSTFISSKQQEQAQYALDAEYLDANPPWNPPFQNKASRKVSPDSYVRKSEVVPLTDYKIFMVL